jgi:hypothetical protein
VPDGTSIGIVVMTGSCFGAFAGASPRASVPGVADDAPEAPAAPAAGVSAAGPEEDGAD